MTSDTKAKLITAGIVGTLAIAGIIGYLLVDRSQTNAAAARYQAGHAKAQAMAKAADDQLLADKAAAISDALDKKATDPAAGIRSLERYGKFSLVEIDTAMRDLHIALARQQLKEGNTDAAHAALLAYQSQPSAEVSKLLSEIATVTMRNIAQKERDERAARKRQGVEIGMTAQRVLQSSWGRPERVNRTINARGTREQWVYPGHHNYLYFENDILVSIQQ